MPSNADIDRDYYLGAVSGSSALMTNSDLERAYWLQMLGLSDPNLLTTTDLKYKFYLANATGGNASMSISDLERKYYLAQAGLSEPYNGSLSDLRQTVPKGNINLLSANQASVETDTTGFAAGPGATIARSTGYAAHALASLVVTATGTGTAVMRIPAASQINYFPVVAGGTYTATWQAKQVIGTRSLTFYLVWCNSSGADIANAGANNTVLTTNFTQFYQTAVAPVNAAYARLDFTLQAGALGDQVAFDCFGFWAGTSTTWAMPPGSPVWTPVNLLTQNQASVETSLADLMASGGVLSRVSGGTHGAYALRVATNATNPYVGLGGVAGSGPAYYGGQMFAVVAGEIITATTQIRTIGVVTGTPRFVMYWWNSVGTQVTTTAIWMNVPTNVFSNQSVTFSVPAGAVYCTLAISYWGALSGEVFELDQIGLWKGAGGSWVMPPPVLNTAVWRVDAANTLSDRLVDLSGNGRDAIFGAAAAAPVVLPYTGEPYVYAPETNDSEYISVPVNMSTPYSSNVDVTIDIDYTPGGTGYSKLWATSTSVQFHYAYISRATNTLVLYYWNGTTTGGDFTGPVIPAGRHLIRVRFTPTGWEVWLDGVSTKTGTWVHVPVVGTQGSIIIAGTLSAPTTKNIKYYKLSASIDGNQIVVFDPKNVNTNTYATVANTGTVGGNWTITRATTGFKTAVVDRPLLLFGDATQHATTAVDPPSLPEITILTVWRTFGTPNRQVNPFSSSLGSFDPGATHIYRTSASNNLNVGYYDVGLKSTTIVGFTGFTVGGQNVLGFLGSNTQITVLGNAQKSTPTTVAAVGYTAQFWRVGNGVGTTGPSLIYGMDGEFISLAIWDKALTDDQIADASAALVKYP